VHHALDHDEPTITSADPLARVRELKFGRELPIAPDDLDVGRKRARACIAQQRKREPAREGERRYRGTAHEPAPYASSTRGDVKGSESAAEHVLLSVGE
jgi:hypothetical protein